MQQYVAKMIAERVAEPENPAVDCPGDIADQERFFARKAVDKYGSQIRRQARLPIKLRMIFQNSDIVVVNVAVPNGREVNDPGSYDKQQSSHQGAAGGDDGRW